MASRSRGRLTVLRPAVLLVVAGMALPGVVDGFPPARGAGVAMLWAQAADIPGYRIVGALVEQSKGPDLSGLSSLVRTLGPYLDRLGRKTGDNLHDRFERTIAAEDREGVIRAIILTALFEVRADVEAIRRDDLAGWTDAKVRAASAYLAYDAVAAFAKVRYPATHAAITQAFPPLAGELKQLDLTTPSDGVDAAKARLLESIKQMAKEVRSDGRQEAEP